MSGRIKKPNRFASLQIVFTYSIHLHKPTNAHYARFISVSLARSQFIQELLAKKLKKAWILLQNSISQKSMQGKNKRRYFERNK